MTGAARALGTDLTIIDPNGHAAPVTVRVGMIARAFAPIAVSAGRVSPADRRAPRPSAAAPAPATPHPAKSVPDALDGVLPRAVRERVQHPTLQRAIIAIDGPGEGGPPAPDASGRATRACLWNLQHRKGGGYRPGDARGKVAGPAELESITIPANFFARSTESLYILGHGTPSLMTIADTDLDDLAAMLRAWIEPQLEKEDAYFLGDVKLVSCVSATEETAYSGGRMKSMAERLAIALGPVGDARFRPQAVHGIVGIGWVDEVSGRIMSVDLDPFLEAYDEWGATILNPFQNFRDPLTRSQQVRAWFGTPLGPAGVPQPHTTPTGRTGLDALHLGKSARGKRRFEVGSGAEILPPARKPTPVDLSNYPHGAAGYL